MDDAVKDVAPKYRSNPLGDFENGVGLDLRVKIAIDLLKVPNVIVRESPAEAARTALDTATELLEQAAARGLLYPVSDHAELTTPLRNHIERNVRASVYQQIVSQRVAREETGGVMSAGASAFPGMHG